MTGFKDGSVRWRQRAVIEQIGEERFFDKYLEVGNVQIALDELHNEIAPEDRTIDGKIINVNTAIRALYDFLHEHHTDSNTGRWSRWQEVLEIRGSIEFDEVNQLADSIDSSNVNRRREQIKAKQWRAERLNRLYSNQHHINIAVGTPDQWLQAISSATPKLANPKPDAAPDKPPRDTDLEAITHPQGMKLVSGGASERPQGIEVQPSGEETHEPPLDSER